MNRTCIAVVDASRARLFVHERTAEPEGVRERLAERHDLVNPARRLRPSQLFSDSSPSSNQIGGVHYKIDDHRDAHIEKLDAEFARDVVEAIGAELHENPAARLILCASPHMLGELRAVAGRLPANLAIDEVPKDLVKLTPAKLHDQLRSYGLLPCEN
jgi:protein required for attachment to host cells